MASWIRKNIGWILLASALVLFDLAAKYSAKILLTPFGGVEIIPGALRLSLSFNPGIAFSIPIPNILMIFIAPILVGLLIWLLARTCSFSSPVTKISIVLLLSGAIGNLINRIWTGSVIDFIDFSFWPSFNLADAYLTAAAFLLILFYGKISVTKYGKRK